MKRIYCALLLLLVVILPLEVNALSVSENNLSINKGNNQIIELSAEVEEEINEVSFSLVYTSYDFPASFNIESGLKYETNGIKHKIIFSEPVSGKIKLGNIKINAVNNPKVNNATVNIHTAIAITNEGNIINLSTQMINVFLDKNIENINSNDDNKETNEITTNLLSKIESEIVKIELKKDVFEYSINIKENIKELDLNPVAIDESCKIEIDNQKIEELENNQIIIKVKKNDVTEEYKINVNIIKNSEITIDEKEFKSSYKYKGKWKFLITIFGITLFIGLLLMKKNRKYI